MYGYGFPPPYGGFMPFPQERGKGGYKSKELVRLAKEVLKQHKMEKKKKIADEKKKELASKPRVFTLLETTGLIFVCSMPFTVLQINALQYIQSVLQAAFNGVHP